ncbi:hypothetical protein FRC08_003246 [Ceratobasidium sp. 394]|nr:hypothetical protein FRC08_003246 [Ceratobasidium sp. 394]
MLPTQANPSDKGVFHVIHQGLITGIYLKSGKLWNDSLRRLVQSKLALEFTNPMWSNCSSWNESVLYCAQGSIESIRPPRKICPLELLSELYPHGTVILLEDDDQILPYKGHFRPITVSVRRRAGGMLHGPLFNVTAPSQPGLPAPAPRQLNALQCKLNDAFIWQPLAEARARPSGKATRSLRPLGTIGESSLHVATIPEPVSQSALQPDSRSALQPASQPALQFASQSAPQLASQPVSQPVSQLASQPNSQPASQPAPQPDSQPDLQSDSQSDWQSDLQPDLQLASQHDWQYDWRSDSQPPSQPASPPPTLVDPASPPPFLHNETFNAGGRVNLPYAQAPLRFSYHTKEEADRRLRVLSELRRCGSVIEEQINTYMIISLLQTDMSSDSLRLIRRVLADL